MKQATLSTCIKRFWNGAIVLGIVVVILGQALRDRWVITMLMMFVPPVVVGAAAWLTAIISRARLPVQVLSTAFLLATLVPLFSFRTPARTPAAAESIRLIHWNVLWGGTRGETSWPSIAKKLEGSKADILLLSEAPNVERLDATLGTLGPGWNAQRLMHSPGERYTCHIAVASRYPVILEDIIKTGDARMICCRITFPQREIRVLLVDAVSTPTLPRMPRLRAVREFVEQCERDGRAVDIIAGDFNAPAACIGFDAFPTMAGGYQHAASLTGECRATWPMILPMWEIDHVWISRRLQIVSADMFTSLSSDHRGQRVDVAVSTDRR